MLKFIETKLDAFRSCFSRTKTFHWFVTVVLSLILRSDSLGVTSFIRALSVNPRKYESILHFFRSDAVSNDSLRDAWILAVNRCGLLHKTNDRFLLLGDGTKLPKEGSHMPGVKKLHQESEDSSKAEYIFGHMFGSVGAVISGNGNSYCLPLDTTIQEGLADTAYWGGGDTDRASSHVVQVIHSGFRCSALIGTSYLVLDRLFLTVPALKELSRLNQDGHHLDIITRAKSNCIAYQPLSGSEKPRKGRPRKKGAAVKLGDLFETRASDFTPGRAMMYGVREDIRYLCMDLLWGQGLYAELRFVLVMSSKGNAIFVSTDTSMEPVDMIEAYAVRQKIEVAFKDFKQQIAGFGYHFWTLAQPKLHRYRKRGEPSPLSTVTDGRERQRILDTVKATERFVLCSSIALGIVQMMALTPAIADKAKDDRYLRTMPDNGKVSEATILSYVRKHFYRVLLHHPDSYITKLIQALQKMDCDAA